MILGIESTAHTLSFGVVEDDGSAKPSVSNLFRPEEGGIHPREAADHHSDVAGDLLSQVMLKNLNQFSRNFVETKLSGLENVQMKK